MMNAIVESVKKKTFKPAAVKVDLSFSRGHRRWALTGLLVDLF